MFVAGVRQTGETDQADLSLTAAVHYIAIMTKPRDNPAEHRFELEADGDTAIAAYEIAGDTITFTHTVVPPALEGKGVGSQLVAYALAQARERNLKVIPACSFVAAYVKRHPDLADLKK